MVVNGIMDNVTEHFGNMLKVAGQKGKELLKETKVNFKASNF